MTTRPFDQLDLQLLRELAVVLRPLAERCAGRAACNAPPTDSHAEGRGLSAADGFMPIRTVFLDKPMPPAPVHRINATAFGFDDGYMPLPTALPR